jgi:hypothetical protein
LNPSSKQARNILRDTTQIGQFYRAPEAGIATEEKERYRPVVKFQKLNPAVLNKVQFGDDEDEDASDDDEEEYGDTAMDTKLDADDSDSETTMTAASAFVAPSVKLITDRDIDINSTALIDMISVEGVSGVVTGVATTSSSTSEPPAKRRKVSDIFWDLI